jgi:hypothetical protein
MLSVAEEAHRIRERFSKGAAASSFPNSCIPTMFLVEQDLPEKLRVYVPPVAGPVTTNHPVLIEDEFESDGAVCLGPSEDEHAPQPACRELPLTEFEPWEFAADRPCTLPPGFFLRQTPNLSDVSNLKREPKHGRLCTLNWNPHLYMLRMAAGYRVLFGRCLRVSGAEYQNWRYFELPFSAYCIVFHVKQLDVPGVEFKPAFVPVPSADPNWWGKTVTDWTSTMNTVPAIPSGAYINFGRLPREHSVQQLREAGTAIIASPGDGVPSFKLTSKLDNHPIVNGQALFPPLGDSAKELPEGGVGYIVLRWNRQMGVLNEQEHCGQPLVFYARLAFGSQALATVPEQRAHIYEAVKFALANCPGGHIVLDPSHAHQTAENFGICTETPAASFGEAIASGSINAVDIEHQTLLLISKWVLHDNPTVTSEETDMEAKFRVEFARTWVPSDFVPASIDTKLGMFARTFEAFEYEDVLNMVASAREIAKNWHDLAKPSAVMYRIAPPDVVAFGDKPVVVVSFIVRVRLGAQATDLFSEQTSPDMHRLYRTVSDYGTRFMLDLMLMNQQLSVVSSDKETLLMIFCDKAPGMLNVGTGKKAMPALTTSTSSCRVIKDPHPSWKGVVETIDEEKPEPPCAYAPHMDLAAANANVALKLVISGGSTSPMGVAGTEVSIYEPGTAAGSTQVSGTCHQWPVLGALIHSWTYTPKSEEYPWGLYLENVTEEERRQSVQFLYAPYYNVTEGQVWKRDGNWCKPGFLRREWNDTAYGVSVDLLHRATFFLNYPGFASEYKRPATFKIWDLKQRCEAVMHWMSRYGRLVRKLLDKGKRDQRVDAQLMMRNYVAAVGRRVPGAPIADLQLSAFVGFADITIAGETRRPRALDTQGGFYEELTTSKFHKSVLPFDDSASEPVYYEDDDYNEDELELPPSLSSGLDFTGISTPMTLGSVFAGSLAMSIVSKTPGSRCAIGSVRTVEDDTTQPPLTKRMKL